MKRNLVAAALVWSAASLARAATLVLLCVQHQTTLPIASLRLFKLDQAADTAVDGRYRIDLTVDAEHESRREQLEATGALTQMTFDRGKLSLGKAIVDFFPGFLSTDVQVATLTLDGSETSLTCQDDPTRLDWADYEGWHRILLADPTIGAAVKALEADFVTNDVRLVPSVHDQMDGPQVALGQGRVRAPVEVVVTYAKLVPATASTVARFDTWRLTAKGTGIYGPLGVPGGPALVLEEAPTFQSVTLVHQ